MGANLQKKIAKAERALTQCQQKLAALRHKQTPQELPDYTFTRAGGRKVKFSQLFGDKDELLVIHNMGASCPYCTLWADGFNGFVPHLQDRAGFAVISEDRPLAQKKFAASRRWKFPLLSSRGTRFRKDVGYKSSGGDLWPGVSAFTKDATGRIFHLTHARLGPGDLYCSLWHLFDLLPERDWSPKYRY
jgi:predicted dithiol-disulfide oxidoreductase (DUF899 family)